MSIDAFGSGSRLPGTKQHSGQTAEEDSVLSGDESDDEDLTESADWDSDDSIESNRELSPLVVSLLCLNPCSQSGY